ncbi:hypothetical protein BDQ17DRAFT_1364166 [Cyathus striatus]|nr:hypothetical protein BDQ17DRAFT_1364166 [Cyathus striatus]
MSRRSSIDSESSAPTSDEEAHESHVHSDSENGAEISSGQEIDVHSNSEVDSEVSDDDDDSAQEPQAHGLDIHSDSDAESVVCASDEDGSEQDAAILFGKVDRARAAYRCFGNDAVVLPVRPQEKRLEQPREGWGRNITEDVVMLTDASSDESDVEIIHKKTKIVTKVKRVRGKLGALKQLPEMPLDILLEIFGQLDPLDLVRLTRTTKTLRRVLLGRSTVGVWKQARGNLVNFPNCPKDMSDQAFACLILETHCQGCLSRTSHICYEFRVRLCTKCIKQDYRFKSEINHSFHYLTNICPRVEIIVKERGRRLTKTFYNYDYIKDHTRFFMNNKERTNWVKRETKKITKIREHAEACDNWLQSRAEERATTLEDIRKKRTDEIIERLTNMGWGDVIQNIPEDDRVQNHPIVAQKKELTERIWKNIQPKLIEFLENQKEIIERERDRQRLEARVPLLISFYEKYSRSKPINTIILPARELYFFQPFQDLISNTPITDVEPSMSDLEDVADGLDDHSAQWKKEMEQTLIQMLYIGPLNKSDLQNAEEILSRGTIAFECKDCSGMYYVRYPRILMHSHARHPSAFGWNSKIPYHLDASIYKLDDFYYRGFRETHSGCISVHSTYREAAEVVISACGLDPECTSNSDLDRLDPFLECTRCRCVTKRLLMTWRKAISHIINHIDRDESPADCTMVTEEVVLGRVKDRRYEAFVNDCQGYDNAATTIYHNRYVCTHCRFRSTGQKIKEHILKVHNKTEINRGDIVRHIDEAEDYFQYEFPVDFVGLYEN